MKLFWLGTFVDDLIDGEGMLWVLKLNSKNFINIKGNTLIKMVIFIEDSLKRKWDMEKGNLG